MTRSFRSPQQSNNDDKLKGKILTKGNQLKDSLSLVVIEGFLVGQKIASPFYYLLCGSMFALIQADRIE